MIPQSVMMFAAGLGTRMRPLTYTCPKPLIAISGRALIDYSLDHFAAAGITTAVVNVHHLADRLEQHLQARQQPRIVISDERKQLRDQGGGIKHALPQLGEGPFFVCNTDSFWIEGPSASLKRLAAAFDPERMDMLLLVAATADSVGFDGKGDFDMDAQGRLSRPAPQRIAPFAYTGVGILRPEPFQAATEEVFPLAPFFWQAAQRGRLFGIRLDGLWLNVERPETIAKVERALALSQS